MCLARLCQHFFQMYYYLLFRCRKNAIKRPTEMLTTVMVKVYAKPALKRFLLLSQCYFLKEMTIKQIPRENKNDTLSSMFRTIYVFSLNYLLCINVVFKREFFYFQRFHQALKYLKLLRI